MRILALFPFYGADLSGGAEIYEYQLTRELAGLAEVTVLTTCTRTPQHTSAFTSRWPTDYAPGVTVGDGVRVQRYPVTAALPALAGHAIARAIFRRWAAEDRAAPGLGGPDTWHRQAMVRPRRYDAWLTLGRGPHALGLFAEARRRAAEFDVIVAGFMPFATLAYATRVAAGSGTPLIVLPFFHPEDRYHHFGVFYRCFARAAAVLAQSPYSAALIGRLVPGARPVQVGVGVEPAVHDDPRISGARFRARHGLGDARVVLFVGRKEPGKRWEVAVQAVEGLGDERVVLVMIGADVDQRPLSSPRVRYLGRTARAELLDAYDACDVFILPSAHESFGIVFLEAWMRGKPVLGNRDCGPVASVIDDGVDGYLCGDPAQYAARIRQLLDDPAAAAALGRAGQRKAMERYTWEAIARRVYSLCEELVAGGGRGRT